MHWEDVPAVIDDWAAETAAPAWDVRGHAADVFTSSHVGYYYDPRGEKVAIFGPLATKSDLSRCKAAASRAVGPSGVRDVFLSYHELADPDSSWVKVAYSQALRRAGEALNFFPGQYPGGLPNHPSPLAAMLTTGLVGAGLGWGAGNLLGRFAPHGYGENLGRTGLLLGGALGAAPGAVWAANNQIHGKGLTDSWPGNHAGDEPEPEAGTWMHGGNAGPSPDDTPTSLGRSVADTAGAVLDRTKDIKYKRSCDYRDDAIADLPLGSAYRNAVASFCKRAYGDAFGGPPEVADVDINALGQTLWQSGASPRLTGSTMGAMYAAQQMPDPQARPGWATGNQLGTLAMNTVGDYGKGIIAGAAINAVVGSPYRASTYGVGLAALGLIGAVVPKLFGG